MKQTTDITHTQRTTNKEKKMAKGYLGTYGARKCKICKGNIEVINGYRDGHNALPVTKGRCCSDCNSSVVFKARLDQIEKLLKKSV